MRQVENTCGSSWRMEATSTQTNRLYNEFKAVAEIGSTNLSVSTTLSENFPKILVISAASEFETRIVTLLLELGKRSGLSEGFVEFVNAQALNRRYHTLFSWEKDNYKATNTFFRLFGNALQKVQNAKFQADEALCKAAADFIKIGRLRNEIVHKNYANYNLELTVDEVFHLYSNAEVFLSHIRTFLGEQLCTKESGKLSGDES